jgi:predicted amino acid-binding ACT domain protein
MSIFGKLVRTAINVATVPIAAVKDVVTLGGVVTEQKESYTVQKLKQIKEEAEDE